MRQCRIVFSKVFATTCHWFPIIAMDIHFIVLSIQTSTYDLCSNGFCGNIYVEGAI
jgi:hypothetical protein